MNPPLPPRRRPRQRPQARTRAPTTTQSSSATSSTRCPQESGPAPVVEEDLHLKLIGTSLLSKSKPYVIVEDDHNTESLYQMGEDIPDAGKLVAVETNRAIIDRDGHRVAIEIPASEIAEVPSSALGSAIRSPRQRGIHPTIQHPAHGFARPAANGQTKIGADNSKAISNLKLKKLGPGKFEASRAEVQQTMENPLQFFSQMRAMPHFVNGKTDAFHLPGRARLRLRPTRPAERRPGDLDRRKARHQSDAGDGPDASDENPVGARSHSQSRRSANRGSSRPEISDGSPGRAPR